MVYEPNRVCTWTDNRNAEQTEERKNGRARWRYRDMEEEKEGKVRKRHLSLPGSHFFRVYWQSYSANGNCVSKPMIMRFRRILNIITNCMLHQLSVLGFVSIFWHFRLKCIRTLSLESQDVWVNCVADAWIIHFSTQLQQINHFNAVKLWFTRSRRLSGTNQSQLMHMNTCFPMYSCK